MTRLSSDRFPKYGKHKQSGQARVVLGGKHILLGPHGTAAAVLQSLATHCGRAGDTEAAAAHRARAEKLLRARPGG